MKRRLIFLLLLLIFLIPSGAVFAQSTEGKVIASGETIDNDVVLFDDHLELQAGAVINGDVTIFDGNATIAGTVNGDVVLFDGDLVTENTAVINGDCVVMTGEITDLAGLDCTNLAPDLEDLEGVLDGITAGPVDVALPFEEIPSSQGATFIGGVIVAIFQSLFFGVIAFAVATLVPQHLQQVEGAIRQKPVAAGTVGFLTSMAVPFIFLLLSPIFFVLAFICGLGVLLAAGLALAFTGAVLFGWFTVGHMFGQRLVDWLNLKNKTLPMTTAIGTAGITFILGVFGAIPFMFGEGLVTFVIVCVGLGAVALTKFGTKSYPALTAEGDIRILNAETEDKVNIVLDTLPDDSDTLN